MISVVIDRTALGLSPLVIGDSRADKFMLRADGLTMPADRVRYSYAAPSPYVAGSLLTSAVADQSFISMTVRVREQTDAALNAAVLELQRAVRQFSFEVSVTRGGLVEARRCHRGEVVPATAVDIFEVKRHQATFNILIPCQPLET